MATSFSNVILKGIGARSLGRTQIDFGEDAINWPTFPQIFSKGEFIGGSDIILNMHQTGELKEKLKDTPSKQK